MQEEVAYDVMRFFVTGAVCGFCTLIVVGCGAACFALVRLLRSDE